MHLYGHVAVAVGVLEVAKFPSMNTNLFAELIDSSGFRSRIESMSTSFTVFLPTNDAIKVSCASILRCTYSHKGNSV